MKRPTRRRRKKTAAARLRPFWFLVVVLFGLAAVAAYLFVTWPALRPHAVTVEGNHIVDNATILQAAGVDPKTNVWLQNTKAMSRRIETIPYVMTASVHRVPPANVAIVVTEREPFARIVTAAGVVVVDHDMRVLRAAGPAFDELPAFVTKRLRLPRLGTTLDEPEFLALRTDEDALVHAHLAISTLEHDKYGDLIVTLHNGIRVLFGDETDLAKKIPLVNPILTQVGRAGRPIIAIDLRAIKTPVVEYKK